MFADTRVFHLQFLSATRLQPLSSLWRYEREKRQKVFVHSLQRQLSKGTRYRVAHKRCRLAGFGTKVVFTHKGEGEVVLKRFMYT